MYLVAASVLIFTLVSHTAGQTDNTLVSGASGRDVVDAVIVKLTASTLFPSNYNFVRRVAYVESRFGTRNDTTNGGIWRVPDNLYQRTKNTAAYTSLPTVIAGILTRFNISWLTTAYTDLTRPLYSGLAFSLYLLTLNASIPQTVISQATFWNTNYNRNTTGRNQTTFIVDVTSLEASEGTCSGRMDLLIVCDGSGSIGLNDFNTAKSFINNLMATFDIESTRMGCMFYSTNSTVAFPLNHTYSLREMQAQVTAFQYQGGWTFTNNAIQRAVDLFNNAVVRAGLPRIMALFTDGMSTEKNVSNIALARAAGLTSFAVGIGSAINESELNQIAYGDTSRVFKLDSYDNLNSFYRQLNSETCSIPLTPTVRALVSDAVKLGEKRYFRYDSSDSSLKLMLETQNGEVAGYYSYSVENPNAALNDGVLSGTETVISMGNAARVARSIDYSGPAADQNSVFVAIEGMTPMNNYTIQALPITVPTGTRPAWFIIILGVAFVGLS